MRRLILAIALLLATLVTGGVARMRDQAKLVDLGGWIAEIDRDHDSSSVLHSAMT